jgi:tetratricopeptide (TPR) repeat protein
MAPVAARAEVLASRPPVDHLVGTPDEVEGWWAAQDEKWIRARELSEKVLRERPGSYAGHFVLGVAMHYGEGDLARSAYHLDLAIRAFEKVYGTEPGDDKPWRWHEASLKEIAFTYGEMDKPAEELVALDAYDKAYKPKRLAQRVWPLMKLRRYEDARAAAKLAIASGTRQQQQIARSDLCGAECEAGNRERAYQACTDALAEFRDSRGGGQVEFSNASEAALSVFKYDEAERFLQESTRRADPDSWGNPFQHLAELYLTEGRLPEAISALKGGQGLRLRRPAWLDQHGQARLDGTLSELLLVLGQTERAAQIARRAVDHPDRQGVHSGTEAQANAAAAIRLATALAEQAERQREDAVTSGWFAGIKLSAEATATQVAAWRERRRAAVLLADEGFLERSIRPYYVGGIDIAMWLMGEAIEAIGGGVAERAIARARAAEPFPNAGPYFDALEAEAHYARGDYRRAFDTAERARATIPHAEALMAGRLAAIAGESARRRGDDATAAARFAVAMVKDPAVFRRLGLALPVEVESDGSDLARRAAGLVRSSPRFRDGPGFHVQLRGDGSACLLGASRDVIQCAAAKIAPQTPPREAAQKVVAELHRVAFAIKADLTQEDMTSLDGSPTAQRADHQVKSLLDSLGP